MNFQLEIIKKPVNVFMINPLIPTSQLILLKMLSGEIFGNDQLIDLKLLVYSNESCTAEVLKLELEKCAFPNMKSVQISTELPRPKDADVFCFISDFKNPNYFDPESTESEIQFDTLYLLIKLANHLAWTDDEESREENNNMPIFVTDGLLALDILVSLSKNLPNDLFYCPSPLEAISQSVLGDYLDVQCNQINNVLVWAANDKVFHVEIDKPLIISDEVHNGPHCDGNTINKELHQPLNLDYTQFNSSWMKKEFLEKVASSASRNPYGCIYKAFEFAKSLKQIWKARTGECGTKVCSNMGVISDGSIGTMKGYPYVLPLVFSDNTWEVSNRFVESTFLRQEMKRINNAVKEQRQKLIPYCRNFLQENVINLSFIPADNIGSTICDDSSSPCLLRRTT